MKFYKVKEKITKDLITIKHMPIDNTVADPLTKALPVSIFEEHVSCMGLWSN